MERQHQGIGLLAMLGHHAAIQLSPLERGRMDKDKKFRIRNLDELIDLIDDMRGDAWAAGMRGDDLTMIPPRFYRRIIEVCGTTPEPEMLELYNEFDLSN